MQLYSETKSSKLYNGNMIDMLEVVAPNSVDSIVTDPPYELNFMGKGWDRSGIAFQKETWEKCYQVLKPGGYLLAFGGTRTFHRIACAIEDAGFEIRDTICWLYGSGFPKSMALDKSIEAKLTTGSGNKKDFYKCNGTLTETGGKGYTSMKQTNVEQDFRPTNYESRGHLQLEATTEEALRYRGWGTALKPAYEPVIVARKPCEGTCVDNVLKYGVGGINIDECRIPLEDGYEFKETTRHARESNVFTGDTCGFDSENNTTASASPLGRFPSNVILTYDDSD
jgi:site-specific DNA-methyltransferase (adenine-specific)